MEKLIADKKERLDVFLAKNIDLSRSKIGSLIEEEYVLVNGKVKPKAFILEIGDEVLYEIPSKKIIKANIPLDIIYEDEYIIAINKDAGVLVHPAKDEDNTLLNALIDKIKLEDDKYGVVHRIDKDTSGIILFAKTIKAYDKLKSIFKARQIKKEYIALLSGTVNEDEAIIDAPIRRSDKKIKLEVGRGGKDAQSLFKVLDRKNNTTLAIIEIVTGRTHQIRVHAEYIGHPIVGDPLYNGAKGEGQLLHAYRLTFKHPITEADMSITAPIKSDFIELLSKNGYNIKEVLKNE